jgi:hypothetical protein
MNIFAQFKTYICSKNGILVGVLLLAVTTLGMSVMTNTASAAVHPIGSQTSGFQCGSGKNAVGTSINFGCEGKNCKTSNKDGCSALTDATFAIIRFLSAGVGIIIIGSTIWAGVQYSMAADDPSKVGKAKDRLKNNFFALMMYIFAYAILNYVIPGGFFK